MSKYFWELFEQGYINSIDDQALVVTYKQIN